MFKKIIKIIIAFFIAIYDIFIGYISPICLMFIFCWFSNTPKGYGYSVPSDELGMYKFFASILLFLYITFLSPSLYFIYKSHTNKKLLIYQIIFILIGIVFYIIYFYFKIL